MSTEIRLRRRIKDIAEELAVSADKAYEEIKACREECLRYQSLLDEMGYQEKDDGYFER